MLLPTSLHDVCFQLCVNCFCLCFTALMKCLEYACLECCVCVIVLVQPPSDSAQDLGQCVNAPCEDAPPPIPAPTPTLYLTQDPDPTIFPALSLPVPALALPPSLDPAQTDGACALGDKGTAGGTSQGMATSAPGQAETSMAAVKLESVLDPKELSTVSAERWRSRGRGGLRAGGSWIPHGPSAPKQSQSTEPPATMC